MANLGRKLLALATFAVVVIGLVVVATSGPANADTPLVFSLPAFPADVGVLRLHMGGTSDYFRFDPSNGSGGYSAGTAELLKTSGCNLTTPLPTSVTLTPTPQGGSSQGKVGLVGHSLGVQVKGEGNGTPCGQVNGLTQALSLSLAGSLASDAMDVAELDVEGKYGVTIKAQLYLDGALQRTELLPTGGPDSGPDSTDGDNFRWRLPTVGTDPVFFDQLKLSVDSSTPAGAFSLEGGSDGTLAQPAPSLGATLGTTDTLFHITNVEGSLSCGGTVSEGGTNGTPSASITLVDTGATCAAVPFALTTINDEANDLQAVVFQKIGGTNNVYNATLTWPVEEAKYPVPPTMIEYDDGSPAHTLKWCEGPDVDHPSLPAGEFWCLLSHDAVQASTGFMQVTEKLFGQGDPGSWR